MSYFIIIIVQRICFYYFTELVQFNWDYHVSLRDLDLSIFMG